MSAEITEQKIFIVEDDLDLAEMLTAYFQAQGYAVQSAAFGEDAVTEIRSYRPDVVLLDIRLPDIDGYEVCRRLRKARRTQHVPVIFLTERRERENKLAGLELGAVDYITKPFDVQELRLRVRNALRRTQLSTQLNPVTGLPEGELVMERLAERLSADAWGAVLIQMHGLSHFRDRFGFVAADDVSRAVALMIANVVKENGARSDYIGHVHGGDYLILTTPEKAAVLAESCSLRLQASIPYFYPAQERQAGAHSSPEIRLAAAVSFTDRDESGAGSGAELLAALGERL